MKKHNAIIEIFEKLTALDNARREIARILRLLAQGLSNRHIAARTQAALRARQLGMLS